MITSIAANNESSIKPVYRNTTIDLLRIFACFGVVVIHVKATTISAENMGQFFLLFCVPFFYSAALVYFVNSLNEDQELKKVFSKIFKRIVVPFISWSVIYLALLLVKKYLQNEDMTFNVARVFLYGESAEHIYYLPQLICLQIIALSVFLLTRGVKVDIAVILFSLAILYLVSGHFFGCFGITSTEAIISYLTLAFFISTKILFKQTNILYAVAGITLIGIIVYWKFFNPPSIEYLDAIPLGGLGLILLTLNIPGVRLPRSVASLAAATYGIYLSHVVFIEAFEFLLERLHYSINYNWTIKLGMAILVFGISTIFTLLIKKNPLGRSLLLGERR
ncbi:MAG TPA: acyltransferase [Segetibacter sp.]